MNTIAANAAMKALTCLHGLEAQKKRKIRSTMPPREEETVMEQIKEAFSYYTRNPVELLGDVIGCVGLFAMLWLLLLL